VIAICVSLAAVATLVGASTARGPATSRAVALIAGGHPGPQVEVAGADGSSERREGAVDVAGLQIRSGEVSATTSLGGEPRARAIAVARSVSALDGVVTAYGVRRTTTATVKATEYSGRVSGLRIGDQLIGDVTKDASFDLPDHSGRVIVNHGTIGLRILMRRDGYGVPKGADVRIAIAEASSAAATRTSKPESAAPTPTPSATKDPDESRQDAAEREARRERRRSAAKRRRIIEQRLTTPAFRFPVFGAADTVDGWGAPRQIGAHQGNDIFAEFGTPVLAVADGTLSKVGTLPISGNRLWLTTAGGDAFFYAHLSSFSPAAVSGRAVKAGTVLGFTGNTGDAEPTPPHVHFEIHPGGIELKAIDPYAILTSWSARRTLAPDAGEAQRPGALVEVRDFIAGE